jgi:serine phosphatase RsbU (regulator of sigma subunit)/PAS domain-containing protein
MPKEARATPIGAGLGPGSLDQAFERSPTAAAVLDEHLRVLRANAAFRALAAADEAALMGNVLSAVVGWVPAAVLRAGLDSGSGAAEVTAADGRQVVVRAERLAAGADGGALAVYVEGGVGVDMLRRRLAGIQELAAALSGAATAAEVTDLVLTRGRELVGAESVAAAILSEETDELVTVGMAGFDARIEEGWRRFGLEPRTPMSDAVTSGRAVFLESAEDRVRLYPHLPNETSRTIAAVPIKNRGAVTGAVAFRFGDARRLDVGDRSLILTIGEYYGQALDRARLFEAAEADRQRMVALMHQLPVGVAIAEAPSGHIVAVNEKATEIWRVPPASPEPITDVSPYVAYHPDGRRYTVEDWPIARSLATGEVVQDEEAEVEFGDGSRGWVSISARPVLDGAGRVLGAVTTLVDVTDRRRREVEARFLAEATDLLAQSLDPDETLRRLAQLAVPRLADWCAVYIATPGGIETVAVAHDDPEKVEKAWEFSRRYPTDANAEGGVAEVVRTGRSAHVPRIERELVAASAPDEDFTRIVYDELGLRSALTVPLQARGERFGALTLVSAESGRAFDEHDVAFAEDFATHAALAVANARLYAAQQDIADTLQRSLLPRRLPDIPRLQAAARYRPAGRGNMIGGDFYDVWQIGDRGEFGIAIGDVCGKGAAAAALTALARHTVRTASLTLPEHGPGDVMWALNDAVIKRAGSGNFCTVVQGYFRPVSDGFDVTLASGGHPLPYLIRADGTLEQPGQPGTLIGVYTDITVREYRLHLVPGDQLVLYTDGVTDRRGEGERFGDERLRDLLLANMAGSPRGVADAIETAVVQFSSVDPQDDIALLVVRIRPE